MKRTLLGAALGAMMIASPALAQNMAPPPPPPGATTQAPVFVQTAGASDLYEITSSRIALQKSQNAEVRRMANMLIRDHTKTTKTVTAAAKAAGMTPPPPALLPEQQAMIDQLNAAPAGAEFDRTYLMQQLPAHQAALTVMQGYAANGDTAQLRRAATSAVPIIKAHINHAHKLHGKVH